MDSSTDTIDTLLSKITDSNILQSLEFIKQELNNDEYYKETIETYLKIMKHKIAEIFTLIGIVPIENHTSTFSFGLKKPKENDVYDPWVCLHVEFGNESGPFSADAEKVQNNRKTSFDVQTFNSFELGPNMYTCSTIDTSLLDALDICMIDLEKRKEINKSEIIKFDFSY